MLANDALVDYFTFLHFSFLGREMGGLIEKRRERGERGNRQTDKQRVRDRQTDGQRDRK